MNKIVVIVSLLLFGAFISLQGQTLEAERDYDFDNWRVVFQMNGPNNWNGKINFVKPVHSKWALRFGMSPIFSFNKTIGDNPDLTFYEYYEATSKNRKVGAELGLGAEFHFLKKTKIDPYLLFGMGIGGFSEISKSFTAYKNLSPTNEGLLEYDRKETSKSAPQLALNPFVGFGFNYFFHERVAFGIEYTCSPNMVLVKGTTTSNTQIKEVFDDGTIAESDNELETNRNAFTVRANPQIGFHLIYVLQSKHQ